MKFSSVVSLHTNPLTCGVARFSQELARRLEVPFLGLWEMRKWGDFPLFSLKATELIDSKTTVTPSCRYGVFWHDDGDPVMQRNRTPDIVFYADPRCGSPS